MKNKKYLLLSSILMLSLVGCSQKPETNENTQNEQTALAESNIKNDENTKNYYMDGTVSALYGAETDFNNLFFASDLVFLARVDEEKESGPVNPGVDVMKTKYSVSILESFKGNNIGNPDLMVSGGEMLIRDYVKQLSPGEYQKRGYSALTEEQLSQYIRMLPENNVSVEVGKTYVFLATLDSANSLMYVACDGYGIYNYNEESQTITNEINNQTISLADLRN